MHTNLSIIKIVISKANREMENSQKHTRKQTCKICEFNFILRSASKFFFSFHKKKASNKIVFAKILKLFSEFLFKTPNRLIGKKICILLQ